jgi:hypothetical protein
VYRITDLVLKKNKNIKRVLKFLFFVLLVQKAAQDPFAKGKDEKQILGMDGRARRLQEKAEEASKTSSSGVEGGNTTSTAEATAGAADNSTDIQGTYFSFTVCVCVYVCVCVCVRVFVCM